jgi:hypothetical protein
MSKEGKRKQFLPPLDKVEMAVYFLITSNIFDRFLTGSMKYWKCKFPLIKSSERRDKPWQLLDGNLDFLAGIVIPSLRCIVSEGKWTIF